MARQGWQQHPQRLRPTLAVLARAGEVGGGHGLPEAQVVGAQGAELLDELHGVAVLVPLSGHPAILIHAQDRRVVLAEDEPRPVAVDPLAVAEVADDFHGRPLPLDGPHPQARRPVLARQVSVLTHQRRQRVARAGQHRQRVAVAQVARQAVPVGGDGVRGIRGGGHGTSGGGERA